MSRVWPVNTLFRTWDRCLFILVNSRLKISLEKKSRQIQAERSDFILNPVSGCHLDSIRQIKKKSVIYTLKYTNLGLKSIRPVCKQSTICRPNMSSRQHRGASRTFILTPDSQPIHENVNWPHS